MTSITFSEQGSNNRQLENLVISHWNDYLQDIEEGETEVSFSDLLFFCTGCKEVPPLGCHEKIEFLHVPEKNGKLSNFPKANTCDCVLALPVTHKSYQSFKDSMTFAIANSKGFGYA